MSKTKVLCFANNKGGSGKSTTCANVGYALSQMGKRVLLVDGDMQLNLSLSYFPEDQVLEMAKGEHNLYTAICREQDLADTVVHTPYEGVDLVPSSTLMSGIEFDLVTKWQREFVLRKCLERVRASGAYDLILIDSPPTLGGWVMNILCASDELIIPVEASPWGLFGLANMFEFFTAVQQLAPQLSLLGVALTKASTRKNYYRQTLDALHAMDGVPVFDSIVRVDSTVEWAQDSSRPVGSFKPSSRSAQEFYALAEEIHHRARNK